MAHNKVQHMQAYVSQACMLSSTHPSLLNPAVGWIPCSPVSKQASAAQLCRCVPSVLVCLKCVRVAATVPALHVTQSVFLLGCSPVVSCVCLCPCWASACVVVWCGLGLRSCRLAAQA
jgi:hypothetical protein